MVYYGAFRVIDRNFVALHTDNTYCCWSRLSFRFIEKYLLYIFYTVPVGQGNLKFRVGVDRQFYGHRAWLEHLLVVFYLIDHEIYFCRNVRLLVSVIHRMCRVAQCHIRHLVEVIASILVVVPVAVYRQFLGFCCCLSVFVGT